MGLEASKFAHCRSCAKQELDPFHTSVHACVCSLCVLPVRTACLQNKELALEDVFAALDTDLDGCLRSGPGSAGARELGRLFLCVPFRLTFHHCPVFYFMVGLCCLVADKGL